MNISKFLSMAFIIAGIGMALGLPKVDAASVAPTLIANWTSGNAASECAQVGTYQNAYKIEPWDDNTAGVYTESGNSITVSNLIEDENEIKNFDWSSTPNNIGAVIVKASTAANIFNYNPQAISDTNLYAPENKGISHVTFCWNTPTATPTPTPTPTNPNGGTIEVNPGLCGETTFTAKKKGTHGVTNMYLVVDSQGTAQSQNVPATGETTITVGPFTTNETLRYRLFGGGERDYDLPLWNGYVPGPGAWKNSINAYGTANGWAWTTNNDTNPFTTWYEMNVDGCAQATPTPTPTPTPTTENLKSDLSVIDPDCSSDQVKAFHKIKINDKDHEGMGIVFKYNGAEQKYYTGSNGEAVASFTYTGDGYLDSIPDGWSGKSHYVTKETNCSNGEVLGTSTEGQILGATTYAETGIAQDVMMSILGLAGAGMFTSGAVLHVKKRA